MPFFFGPLSVGEQPVGEPQLTQIFDQLKGMFPGMQGPTTYAGPQGTGLVPSIGFSLDYNPFGGTQPSSVQDVFSGQDLFSGSQRTTTQMGVTPESVTAATTMAGGNLTTPSAPAAADSQVAGVLDANRQALAAPGASPPPGASPFNTGMSDTQKGIGAATTALSIASGNPITSVAGLVGLVTGRDPLFGPWPTPYMRFGGNLTGTLREEQATIDMLGGDLRGAQTQGDIVQAIANAKDRMRRGEWGGDVIGGFGLGTGDYDLPDFPGAGGSEHEWGQVADFGPQVTALRDLITFQRERLPGGPTSLGAWSDVIAGNVAARDAEEQNRRVQELIGLGAPPDQAAQMLAQGYTGFSNVDDSGIFSPEGNRYQDPRFPGAN